MGPWRSLQKPMLRASEKLASADPEAIGAGASILELFPGFRAFRLQVLSLSEDRVTPYLRMARMFS